MPFCKKHKIIFIHIPKCAGSSIEVFFDLQHKSCLYEPKNILSVILQNKKVAFAPQHFTIEMVKNYLLMQGVNYEEFLKFTFVRNPYDRMVSEFLWQVEHKKLNSHISKHDFETWLKAALSSEKINDHLLPQIAFTTEKPNNHFDFIGRVERFNDDFSKLLSMIGISSKNDYPLLNCTHYKDKRSILSTSAKGIIFKYFIKDFEVFEYPK